MGRHDLVGYVFEPVMGPNGSMDIGFAFRFKMAQEGTEDDPASSGSDMLKHDIYMNIVECVPRQTSGRIINIKKTKISFW
jgi:hypothetical protein